MSTDNSHHFREKLSSRLGFILLAAGCAVGLGNVWRFPYVTGQNGGAIFVIIYLACLMLIAVPCLMMELSIGRASQKSIAGAIESIEPPKSKWHIAKYPMLLGPYVLMSFYTVITGWLLYYLVAMVRGDFSGLEAASVAETSKMVQTKFSSLLSDPFTMIGFAIMVIALSTFICVRGVQKGVEKVTKPMMVILLLILICLAGYCMTLDNAVEGLKFYLYPDMEKVKEVGLGKVFYEALNQAFFTLSIGQGSILIFGSYIDKKCSLVQESVIIASLDTFVAIMAGLIIFPACLSYNVDVKAGPTLLFISMLNVFGAMEYGRLIGSIFFSFMFFAAFTTVITVMESIIANTMECFKTSRRMSVFVNFLIISIISIPCALGFNAWSDVHPLGGDSAIIDLEDFIVSNNILPLGCLFFVIFCCFGWGFKNYLNEVNYRLSAERLQRKWKDDCVEEA